ncbi:MAG: hypothetical protein M3N53_02405 [Actinomycetota bacterium]|nr:hypothetical protein [Actinomycetota bacterium]
MRTSLLLRLVAALMAFALIGAACGGSGDETTETTGAGSDTSTTEDTTDTETGSEPQPVDAEVASLQQTLTQGLTEHEYLAGIAVAMAVQNPDQPELFEAAAAALDENSVDLSKAIASIYGKAGGDQFLKLWRKHIGFFVQYTQAGGVGAEAKAAKKGLDEYRADFGAFIEGATEGALPKAAVQDALKPHVDSTFAAIDAVLGKSKANPFEELYTAAGHLPGIATALTGGIAQSQGIEGDPMAPSAQLLQTLTAGLNGHEYLAGSAVAMAVMHPDQPELFEAAAAALDKNSVDLSEAVASVYGEAGGDQFLKLWRKHIGFFVAYTQAGGEGPQAAKAKKDLDGYRSDFGAFIESATEGGLPKAAVEDALKPHVDSTLKAIDGILGKEKGNPFILLKEAASHLPGVATALSTAIVQQMPDKFI